jgi:hypothetical protein
MTIGTKGRSFFGRSLIVFVALLATMTLGVSRVGIASAQDATPGASPAAGPCDAPALPPGTPTPQEATAATPEMNMASPAAAETEAAGEATAEATAVEEEAQATPADEATTTTADAAATNLANCINGGNFEGAAALMTTNFMQTLFGTGNPYDVVGELQGTQFGNFAAGAVSSYADGSVSVDVTYMQTEYQFISERWTLVQDGGYWKIDDLESLSPQPEGDTGVLGFVLTEYAFTAAGATEITEMPVLLLHGANQGAEPHEMVVLKLPEGMTVDQLLADESLFSQVEFIGQSFFEPGQEGDMALVNLPPGTYTLVCFVTAPDGQPHAAKGMVSEFTVDPATPASPEATPTS